MVSSTLIQRSIQLLAGGVLFLTALSLYEGYQLWKSAPPVVAEGLTQTELAISALIALLVILATGLYISKNMYFWSKKYESN